ncbi:MAG: NAD(P)-dependent alcohol dehydrogenase [Edaphobacter sp.]
MKSWLLEKHGLENLRMVEMPDPEPGPKQIVVRNRAASLNYRDWDIVSGHYSGHFTLPLVLGSDAAGDVVKVGAEVSRFKIGDRVTTLYRQNWVDGQPDAPAMASALGGPLPGVLSEYILLEEDGAIATPPYLSDAEASTLPIAALTAWFALVENGQLKSEETVLVQGTGGVSIFGLQIAKALGARVIATSSSDAKLERAKSLGADNVVNYIATPDWDKAALDLTHGNGVDHVIEIAGGESLQRSVNAIRIGGHIAIIGYLDDTAASLNVTSLLWKRANIRGVTVGPLRAFERMMKFFATHEIHPVIDATYSFAETPKALAHLKQGAFGKIVIQN